MSNFRPLILTVNKNGQVPCRPHTADRVDAGTQARAQNNTGKDEEGRPQIGSLRPRQLPGCDVYHRLSKWDRWGTGRRVPFV